MIDLEQENAVLETLQALAGRARELAGACELRFGDGDKGRLMNRGNYVGATARLLQKMLEREAADQVARVNRYARQEACDHPDDRQHGQTECGQCHAYTGFLDRHRDGSYRRPEV